MMDKKLVLQSFIKEQEEKLEQLTEALNGTRRDVQDAPGSNVSHSDTMKSQHSNLALGIEKSMIDARRTLAVLNSLLIELENSPVVFDRICEGAFFVLKNTKSGKENAYLAVSDGGGASVEVDGKRVVAVSMSAPIIDVVIDKRKGDKVSIREKNLEIIDVQ